MSEEEGWYVATVVSPYDAAFFDEEVQKAVEALPGLPRGCIIEVRVEQPYEDKGRLRWRTVYDRHFRETE